MENQWSAYWYQNHQINTLGFDGETLSHCQAVRGTGIQRFDQICAFLIIDVSADRFRDVICSLQLPGDPQAGQVFLIDAQGQVMLDDGRKEVDDHLARNIARAEGSIGFLEWENQEITYIKTTLSESGWILAAAMPRENLLANSRMLRSAMFIVILALLLVSALGAGALAFATYTHSVRQQISSINLSLAQSGQVVGMDLTGRDLFQLNKGIEELLQTAAHATEEAYDARLRERDAVLRALQAQINPHFLYNTLDTINWMAIEANATNVSRMIETLGYYYRMSLSKGQDIVPFSDEIAIVKAYLELQSERFDHEFTISMDLAEEPAPASCPS